jgi:hypothetical protein
MDVIESHFLALRHNIITCNVLKIKRYFGGKYHLCLQGLSKLNKKPTSCASYLLHAGFLIGVFFGLEDGGDMFFQNVG